MAEPPRREMPELLDLLQRQTASRRLKIRQNWDAPSHTPEALYRFFVEEPERFSKRLQTIPHTEASHLLLVDMVQEYSLPVALGSEDHKSKQLLAEWGLIFPFPAEWGPEDNSYPQWSWVLPVDTAILCAPSVEVFRFGHHLLLARLSDEALGKIAEHLKLPRTANRIDAVLQIAHALPHPEVLGRILLDPDWQEHLFTLQILLEWHGVCHRQELFSFAWGDDTLRPLTDRVQQRRERQIEQDLTDLGLVFLHMPPPDDAAETPAPNPEPLLVLPEELRAPIWNLNRHLQEQSLVEHMHSLGGWSAGSRGAARSLQNEPTDLIKALICMLEATPLDTDESGAITDETVALLEALSAPESAPLNWRALLELGQLTRAFVARADVPRLDSGPAAHRLTAQGPTSWSNTVLQLWVEGTGPAMLDLAQNQAIGLGQTWLEEIGPSIRRATHRHEPLEGWWRFIDRQDSRITSMPAAPPKRRSRRQPGRPVPSWLRVPGVDNPQDILCGFPRTEPERDRLEQELLIVEGIVLTWRMLMLDLLSGLPSKPIPMTALAALFQDTAALSVHLNLPAMFFDPLGQTFIPVRPPTYLVESANDVIFEAFATVMLEHLLIPAGVAELLDGGESVRILGHRIAVATPRWFDHGARLSALSATVDTPASEIAERTPNTTRLRPVTAGLGESDRRFWLGRPLDELRRAVAGHRITALREGYVEIK